MNQDMCTQKKLEYIEVKFSILTKKSKGKHRLSCPVVDHLGPPEFNLTNTLNELDNDILTF